MKLTLTNTAVACLLAASFAAPVMAQTDTAGTGADANRTDTTMAADRDDDHGFDDWGLLGLLGLAGLMRKPKEVVVRDDVRTHTNTNTNTPR